MARREVGVLESKKLPELQWLLRRLPLAVAKELLASTAQSLLVTAAAAAGRPAPRTTATLSSPVASRWWICRVSPGATFLPRYSVCSSFTMGRWICARQGAAGAGSGERWLALSRRDPGGAIRSSTQSRVLLHLHLLPAPTAHRHLDANLHRSQRVILHPEVVVAPAELCGGREARRQ